VKEKVNVDVPIPVGYDTAVIGGTMALNSFIRDFGMDSIAKSNRDTIQGNIVSSSVLTIGRPAASSVHLSPSLSPSASAGNEP
jgi:hypothetical protein